MSALDKINDAYLELLSAAVIGNKLGGDVASDLRKHSDLWTKVYVSDETIQLWMDLAFTDTFVCSALYLLAPSNEIEKLMALANTWEPACITARKTAYETPYHSVILLFTS
jgi:hypothetical protein